MNKHGQQQASALRLLALGAITALALSFGCGGGAGRQSPEPPPPAAQDPDAAGRAEANTLFTSLPVLSRLSAGAEFEFTVNAQVVDELYQGSGRVLYDPAVMQPIAAERGAQLPQGFIFVAKLDAGLTAGDGLPGLPAQCGVVPYAFTGLPEAPAYMTGRGELLRLRFKLLRQPPPGCAVRLLNNPEYLQLRAPDGRRLAFDISSGAGP